MTTTDYVIIVVYFVLIVAIGFYFRQQPSLRDFFLGGQNVPWWAATFSGIATIVSAVSYLGAPGVAFAGNFTFHQYRLGLPVAILVLCLVILPLFHTRQRFSIYEYFEERFDLKTRLFASGLFILLKTCYVGVAIYAPALVIKQMFGISVWYVVALVGGFTTLYSMLGGIKAVVWTDTLQLFVMLGGLLVVAVIAVGQIEGGLAEVIAVGSANEKFRFFDASQDLTTRYTIYGGIIGGTILLLSQYGADQAEIQRFLATRSLSQARVSLTVTMLATFVFGLFVFFVGTILFAFYTQYPEKGGFAVGSSEVFPKFIVEELPTGVKGLLVACVLSAAMSTVSSVLNSLTSVTMADFYNRFAKREASVRLARIGTLFYGLAGIAIAGIAGSLGNILEAAMTLNSFFGGPLVGVFLLGMVSKRAKANAAFAGMIIGLGVSLALGVLTDVSFLWYCAFSAAATFAAGFLFSRQRQG